MSERPAVPVVFGHAVLDGHDGVAVTEPGEVVDPARGVEAAVLAGERVGAVARRARWRRCRGRARSRCPGRYPAASIAVRSSERASSFEGRFGAKPPSSPTAVDRPAVVEQGAERVVRLGAPAERLAEAGRADGGEHELLDVDVAGGVGAAVDDVQQRHGQDVRVDAADVAVQGQAGFLGGGVGDGERHREGGVRRRAAPLFGVPSRTASSSSRRRWSSPSRPVTVVGDLGVDVLDRAADALAAVAAVAVAELDGLVGAGAGPAGHRGPAPGPRDQLTSASTVGLPRESRISRPMTSMISLMARPLGGSAPVARVVCVTGGTNVVVRGRAGKGRPARPSGAGAGGGRAASAGAGRAGGVGPYTRRCDRRGPGRGGSRVGAPSWA